MATICNTLGIGFRICLPFPSHRPYVSDGLLRWNQNAEFSVSEANGISHSGQVYCCNLRNVGCTPQGDTGVETQVVRQTHYVTRVHRIPEPVPRPVPVPEKHAPRQEWTGLVGLYGLQKGLVGIIECGLPTLVECEHCDRSPCGCEAFRMFPSGHGMLTYQRRGYSQLAI